MTQPTEKEVRALRDKIYGVGSDSNWEGCRDNWMRPDAVKWLQKEAGGIAG